MTTQPTPRPVAPRIPKLWTSVLRQSDGTWKRDDMPTTKAQAKKYAQLNRIMGGISTQIVEATPEEIQNWKEENLLV
jgi:hypothetical protein